MAQGDGEVNIHIKTTSDARGVEQAWNRVKGFLGEIKNAPGLLAKLGVAVAGVTAAYKALQGAIRAAKFAINEFAEAETRFRSWARAAANNGNLTQEFANKVTDLADEMERLTKIDGERWMAALEEVTKRGANADNIESFARAIANLAGLMGKDGDIEQAAAILGRALAGNFRQLKLLGIEVDETQSRSEQLASVFTQAARGAGLLEERAKGVGGALKAMSLLLKNTAEAVAGLVLRNTAFQYSFAVFFKSIELFNKLLPQSSRSVEGFINASADAVRVFQESAQAAEAASDGFGTAQTALEKLSAAYDAAAKAAEKFRQEQDELDDAEAANKLAEIDLMEAKGVLSSADARKARAATRRDVDLKKVQRQRAALDEEEARLSANVGAASRSLMDAEAAMSEAPHTGNVREWRAARKRFQEEQAAAQPRLDAIRHERTKLGFVTARIGVENQTEVVRAARETGGQSQFGARDFAGRGWGEFGAAMQENSRLQQGFGSEVLGNIRSQNQLLEGLLNENVRLREEIKRIQQEHRQSRNQ